jgi:hypothetical protein
VFYPDDPTAASSLPVPGPTFSSAPTFFVGGNPASAQPATLVRADWLNAVTLELINVVLAGGLTPTKGVFTQVVTAIREMIQQQTGNYALDTGAVNAYVVALSPAVTAPIPDGMPVRFRAGTANTGPATIDMGTGPLPLLNDLGQPLVKAAIGAGAYVTGFYTAAAKSVVAANIATYGSAAQANASSATGIVAAVSGATTSGNVPLFADAAGTLKDSGLSWLALIAQGLPSDLAYLDRLQSWTKAQRRTVMPVSDGTPAIDLTFSDFSWSLGGNRTLPAPTNAGPGQSGVIWITPNGFSLTCNAFWHPIYGVLPVFPTTNTASPLVYETSPDGTFAVFALVKGGL